MNNINVLHKQDRDRKNLVCYKLSATFWQIVNRLLPTECNSLLFLRLLHAHIGHLLEVSRYLLEHWQKVSSCLWISFQADAAHCIQPVRLRVVGRGEAMRNAQSRAQLPPDRRRELHSSIRGQCCKYPEPADPAVEEGGRTARGRSVDQRHCLCPSCAPVHHGQQMGAASR